MHILNNMYIALYNCVSYPIIQGAKGEELKCKVMPSLRMMNCGICTHIILNQGSIECGNTLWSIVEKKSMGGELGFWPLVRPHRQFETLKTS